MPAVLPTVEFLGKNSEPPATPEFVTPSQMVKRRPRTVVMNPAGTETPPPAAKPAAVLDPNEVPPSVAPLGNEQEKPQPGQNNDPKPASQQGGQNDQPNVPGQQAPPAEPDKGEDKNIAKAWAAVMRKDAEVQKSLAQVREYQKDQPGYQEYVQNKAAFENFKKASALLTTDPDEALRLLGAQGGYSEISERMLERVAGGQVKDPQTRLIETLASKIEGLEKRLEDSSKTNQQREKDEARLTVENYIGQLDTFIRQKPEDFPLLIGNNATPLVFDTMKAYYEKNGKYLSEQEAAELVENHFRKQARELISNPFIRKALELDPVAPVTPQPPDDPGSRANNEPPKTLTNSLPTGGVPPVNVEAGRTLTREEQIRRLVARKYGPS